MKCCSFVKERTTPKTKKVVVDKKELIFDSDILNHWPSVDLEGYVVCDGDIEGKASLFWEPYWGGEDVSLSITYKCKRCGSYSLPPGLPEDISTLSKFLTDTIAAS